jgi:serine/threonine protein kinase
MQSDSRKRKATDASAVSTTADSSGNITSFLLPTPHGACRKVADFKKINRIGQGTYGFVYRAKVTDKEHSDEGETVALKRIIMHNESQDGFPLTSLREVKTLRRCCRHTNIVQLLDVVVGSGRDAVFLLFEYCEHDLSSLITNAHHNKSSRSSNDSSSSSSSVSPLFKESEVKSLTKQLLSAMEYIHRNHVVHRDIKLSNLLYNSKGQLKVADFGLARTLASPVDHESNSLLTTKVVTLWYRSPELLLGCTNYSFSVDMWSVGCIFAELLTNEPLLPGNTEMEQIKRIFGLLGSPSERIWPGVSDLSMFTTGVLDLQRQQQLYIYNNLSDALVPFLRKDAASLLSSAGSASSSSDVSRQESNVTLCLDFVNSLLTYDPDLRATARNSLLHAYFRSSPLPTDPHLMPTFPTRHDDNL